MISFDWRRILHFGWHYKSKRRYKECGYREGRDKTAQISVSHMQWKMKQHIKLTLLWVDGTCHISTEWNLHYKDLLTNISRNINTAIHSLLCSPDERYIVSTKSEVYKRTLYFQFFFKNCLLCTFLMAIKLYFKWLVHPKMKISPCFTHPQSILGVYDFLLSDEFNRSYIKNSSSFERLQVLLSAPNWIITHLLFSWRKKEKRNKYKTVKVFLRSEEHNIPHILK